jgi:hypothetical protein
MEDILTPSYADAERCIELRKMSKQGQRLTEEESSFCEKIWEQYNDWYKKTEKRIFEETKPFGA